MNNKKQSNIITRSCAGLMIAGIISILMVVPAQAAPLNLTLNPFPDITSTLLDVNYDSVGDILTVLGGADDLKVSGSSTLPIAGGIFDLLANIDGSGALTAAGSSLTIFGTASGFSPSPLLTGDLTAFGFGAADTLEFLFDVTGGEAAGLYGGIGATAGVIVTGSGFFSGDFTVDFDGSGFAAADTQPVPEPSTVVLLLAGLCMLGYLRWQYQGRETVRCKA